jgi:glycyl-tRNA synthetase beta chain
MVDFLLELRSEEIPARMQANARNELARLFAECTGEAGLTTGAIDVYSTPRRLALIARDVSEATDAAREELKGPRTSAPAQALEGFLRKTGLSKDQLEERDGVYFALHGIVAILGDEIVPVEIGGIASGATTVGHRFHHPGDITIGGAQDYAEKLRACHVIVDQEERERLVREGAAAAATRAGLTQLPDEGLVIENAGLTEWPVPLIGRFDPEFLDVPREVIVLTMRTNQKYFACTNDEGLLAPAFVCIANIAANDGGEAIAQGNARVLAARLADARFFWEQDVKVPLEDQAKKLSGIVFHEKLGTVADRVERVAKLARWLAEEEIVKGAKSDEAERAARLAKADLVTGMVGEFPELQGVIGGYLADAQGEPKAIADAIRDHYKPVGQGDEVPTAPVTVAVALADKLDSLVGFFQVDEKPTGSRDPFALRRAALGILALILENGLRAEMFDLITAAAHREGADAGRDIAGFLLERLKVQQREAGVRHDLIDAVAALRQSSDNWLIIRRVQALQSFIESDAGADLLTAYKRAANILKKENWAGGIMSSREEDEIPQTGEEDPLVLVDDPILAGAIAEMAEGTAGADLPQEKALIAALDEAERKASAAIDAEEFTAAMAALALLRKPIDDFFDHVTVNDPDAAKREHRLNLLMRFRDAVNRVADFSKIEG